MNIICNPLFATRKYPSNDSKLRCFIIMPFAGDLIQDIYRNCTKPTIEKMGIECYRGDDIFSISAVIEDIFGAICQADIVVCEFTGKNPNVLYEAGIAHTLGKPLIGITQDIDDIPFDLRSLRHITYSSAPSGYLKFMHDLEKTIKTVLDQHIDTFPKEYVDQEEQLQVLFERFRDERLRTDRMYSMIEARILRNYEHYHTKIRELSQYSNNPTLRSSISFVNVDETVVDVDYFDTDENEVINISKERVGAFEISKTPITNKQYYTFMKETGHPAPDDWYGGVYASGEDDNPVIGVSWVDVTMFCRWFSDICGQIVDIPTEAQWLAAAGYSSIKQLYPWGNNWFENACNSNEFSKGKRTITPVDFFEKNVSPCGCIDMLGNVWEWTKSPYDFQNTQGFQWRAVRGGANYTDLKNIGNLARLVAHPGHFLFVHDLGFRVIRHSNVTNTIQQHHKFIEV